MKITDPLVYIIILNWNGYRDTVECLRSIEKISYKNFEVVVVDNGSKNNEAGKLKRVFPKIQLIQNRTNRGYADANNQGIDHSLKSKAKYTLLLNNDTVVKKDFLNILVDHAETNNIKGILSPKILYYKTNKIWAMGGKISVFTSIPKMIGQGKLSTFYQNIINPDYAPGCALFIANVVFRKIGKLNPIYFAYYEDADLSFRTKKAGYKMQVIPKSVIEHKVSQSTKNKNHFRIGPTQSYLLARNGLIFGKLNFTGAKRLVYLTSQYLIKLPLYIIIKCQDLNAQKAYVKGIRDGSLYLFKNAEVLDHTFF